MTGSDHVLDVYLGKNKIALLSLNDEQLAWNYLPDWQRSGYPLSPHLPLTSPIPSINVQRFLRNLLPEGDGLEELVRSFHLSRYNTFGLIRALGMDTPGSLQILPTNQLLPTQAVFRPISLQELAQRLDTAEEFGLVIWDGKPRLSVAGIQQKINVVVDSNGQLGFGEGSLCSTHLLKFEKQKLAHLVLNEFVTMRLAKACGLKVAQVSLLRVGKHPTLLVERFDRQFVSVDEVKRRPIIDGCQALNLSPDEKYERNFGNGRDVLHIRDGASLIKLFDFASQCMNPALTKQQMLDWVIFNILVFNFDAHGKNISFFVSANGLSLTPFYDLVNAKMYPQFAQEMAMGLGDEFDGNTVNAYQLADFSDCCQLPRSLLVARLKHLIKTLLKMLNTETRQILTINQEESDYLTRYQTMIQTRCKHVFNQISLITKIQL